MKSFFTVVLFFFVLASFGQSSLKDIELSKIAYKKVRQYILHQEEMNVVEFSDIKGSYSEDLKNSYQQHTQTYLIKKPLAEVWEKYKSTSPAISWNGKMVKFGCLISKFTNKTMYQNDAYDGAEIGQVFFVNLKLLRGIFNLGVAFELTNISEKENTIEYSYVNGGKTQGKQWIKMESTADGFTKITHHTLYKSTSSFRDVFLYPYVHTLSITEFHKNMLLAN